MLQHLCKNKRKMFIINFIQFILLGLWTFIFVYVLTILLPSRASLWLTTHLWAPVNALIVMSSIKPEGLENIDPKKNYIFMANHTSFFDIPCLFWASKRLIHFLCKAELRDNILTGFMIRKLDMVFIDRSNAQNSVCSMRHTEEIISKGNDIAIFPEGTRSKTGEMLPFKRGGFKLAIYSNTEIVPVTIKNSAKAWSHSNLRFRPTKVTVHFHEPISVQGLKDTDALALSKQVFEIINTELKR